MNVTFSHAVIESIAHVLPPKVLSSEAIEEQLGALYKRLHLPLGRLELMTGIRERRIWEDDILPSQASTEAARKVLEKTSIPRERIDLLIHAAVCRDYLEPATAAYVHHNLKLSSQTAFFDLSNACLGFLNAMALAASLIDGGQIRSALIVSGENSKPLLDHTLNLLRDNNTITRREIKSYFANLTIGSAAVAALIVHESLLEKRFPRLQMRAMSLLSDSEGCDLCQGDRTANNALAMETDSEALLHRGIQLAENNWRQFLDYTKLSMDEINHTICHQVGQRHRTLLCQALKLDPNRDLTTFPFLGNTGSVALPITLSHALENELILSGEKIVLLGIGSGISALSMFVEAL
ncbi:MAG: 3-oxoacyl-ACP synthase III [Puniceicoccales bacterium]|jgi:3-oxoacyl-[acyl-carrier-protein] synthase-3|nr:3-oxoacyl-ACP synthase III [Puniceicoccales bacterium]